MGTIKQINIKNSTYFFFDDMINIRLDSNLIKIDKKSFKNIGIYYIGYITKKDQYTSNSVNRLYIVINKVDGSISKC